MRGVLHQRSRLILVSEAIRNDIDVIVVPGVVAGITALVASGLSTERFTFYGFCPANKKKNGRTKGIEEPHRNSNSYEAPIASKPRLRISMR